MKVARDLVILAVILEQREESHGPRMTVVVMRCVLLGLADWRWSVALNPLGVKIVQLVTADPEAARCLGCGQISTSPKEWVCTRPKDVACGGGPVVLCGANGADVAAPRLVHSRRSPSRWRRYRPGCERPCDCATWSLSW